MAAATRRRGRALDDALLDAAWIVLGRVGYAKMTMEAVAAEASTSKSVLYRRWPTLPALVLAAIHHREPPLPMALPDTGTLRGDLRAHFSFVSALLVDVAGATSGLLAEFAGDPELLEAVRGAAFGSPTVYVQGILDRAAERGEIPTATLPERTLTAPLDVARYQLIMTKQPLDDASLDALVDDVALPLYRAVAHVGTSAR